ncbi:hypothetical protein FQA39_LY03277 [Lamprigera yunnana]|nr:hypothetical protein FQA39_LY03277 [Lamprigera yunnana]
METRSIKQKTRETEGQGKIQILQEEKVEEQTKIDERIGNCKEDKMMQMLIQMMQQNSALVNYMEENNQKLDETRTEIRTEMDQSMEKIQRQFLTIQEWINMKREKKEIVNYIEEKIKIGNGTGHNVITNYSKIEREAPKFHPSKNQHPKVYFQELQIYLTVIKKQIGNQFDQAMEDAIIREAMRGETETCHSLRVSREEYALNIIYLFKQLEENVDEKTIVHILAGQFEEETHIKVMIDETKNFDDLVKILKAHDQCEKDRKRVDGSKYYNLGHYSNYQYQKYNHGDQERDNYNYPQEPSQFYHNNHNRNQRFEDNRRWNDYGNRQHGNTYRYREQTREGRNQGTFKRYKNENNTSGERNVNINNIVQQPRE